MKIGFACGVFDLFHAGHVLMLQECKQHCDYLIVALNKAEHFDTSINPGKHAPVFNLEERMLIVGSCKYVDEVLSYSTEEELAGLLREKKISIRFLGDDYRNKPITGAELPIELYYTSRSHGLSTSSYLKKIRALKD
ncbi:MAG TPA: adenylyltransferase/cytidyltransferase family protein [Bacteroidia bacterium]|jgi:glycerol-3-phosphate cytidylyltransferase|nr:adenylyltransferase/cytidyltransferase family protein [Bacteroidia bacterium]